MTNKSISDAFARNKTHTVAAIAEAKEASNRYTDTQIISAKSYSDTNLASAKTYTNESIANYEEVQSGVNVQLSNQIKAVGDAIRGMATLYSGTSEPDASLGKDGDYYILYTRVDNTGYSVDFTDTDTRERWTDEETHYGSGGNFYFKINGTQYDVQDTSVLVKYTGVTSFEVMGTNHSYGSQDMSMTYITGADGLVNTVTWTSDEQNVWKTIDVTYDIVIVSFEYSSCLTGDTMITMANGTEKRLDTLEKGDMVIAVHPETHELVPAKLLYCNRLAAPQYAPQYDVWTFEDGSVVKTVKRHRLYNVDKQAMVYMDEWQIGERAYNQNGEYTALVSHEVVSETVQHFTLYTEYQNYFVNGILAGNRHTPKMEL